MSDADIDTVTAADVTGLNRAVVARAADLARLVGTGLLIVAGLGVLAWAWLVLRGLDVIGDQYFGEDLAFNERVDLVAGYVSLLLFSGLAAGVGVGLRLRRGRLRGSHRRLPHRGRGRRAPGLPPPAPARGRRRRRRRGPRLAPGPAGGEEGGDRGRVPARVVVHVGGQQPGRGVALRPLAEAGHQP